MSEEVERGEMAREEVAIRAGIVHLLRAEGVSGAAEMDPFNLLVALARLLEEGKQALDREFSREVPPGTVVPPEELWFWSKPLPVHVFLEGHTVFPPPGKDPIAVVRIQRVTHS